MNGLRLPLHPLCFRAACSLFHLREGSGAEDQGKSTTQWLPAGTTAGCKPCELRPSQRHCGREAGSFRGSESGDWMRLTAFPMAAEWGGLSGHEATRFNVAQYRAQTVALTGAIRWFHHDWGTEGV